MDLNLRTNYKWMVFRKYTKEIKYSQIRTFSAFELALHLNISIIILLKWNIDLQYKSSQKFYLASYVFILKLTTKAIYFCFQVVFV